MNDFNPDQDQIELKDAVLMIVIALAGSLVFIAVGAYTVAKWVLG